MEKWKTALLILLVGTSLLQSYFLAYSTPQFDTAKTSKYVETKLVGTQAEAEDVLFPEQIVLHFGNMKHTVLYPDHGFYKVILDNIRNRKIDGFLPISDSLVNWNEYRDQYKGVEIRFNEGIRVSMLARIMQLTGDNVNGSEIIDRIWIAAKEDKEEVYTYFISDTNKKVYQATKADLGLPDVERFVGFGAYLTNYRATSAGYYLPEQQLNNISVVKLKIPYEKITPDQMKKSLFADPGTIRNLQERDGSQIFSDGKRGLQIKNDQMWMIYSDSVAPVENDSEVNQDFLSTVQFINQHGGWNGKFRISAIPKQTAAAQQVFQFQEYVNSLPVLAGSGVPFGQIRMTLQKGVVSNYERSLVKLDTSKASREPGYLAFGEALNDMVQQYRNANLIRDVFPAYRASIGKDYVELTPVWAVRLTDGSVDFL